VIGGLLVSSIVGTGGLLHVWRLRAERGALGEDVFALLHKNDGLRRKILGLRRSDRQLERLARQQLGLVRDGEIVYRFRASDEGGAAAATSRPALP